MDDVASQTNINRDAWVGNEPVFAPCFIPSSPSRAERTAEFVLRADRSGPILAVAILAWRISAWKELTALGKHHFGRDVRELARLRSPFVGASKGRGDES